MSALTLRGTKESELTHDEVDGNFASLNNIETPFDHGAVGGGEIDDTEAFQAFLTSISSSNDLIASAHGKFLVTDELVWTQDAASMPVRRRIIGDCRLVAGTAIPKVLTIENANGCCWEMLSITGEGSASTYSSLTCEVGLFIAASGRCDFQKLNIEQMQFAGIAIASGNSSACDLGNVRTKGCASGRAGLTASTGGAWSNPVNSGSAGSSSQYTTIDVTVLPPTFITDETYADVGDSAFFVRIDGELYYVLSVDTENEKLTVFPWVDSTATPGNFEYVFGGGVYIKGADSNVVGIGAHDAIDCGVGISDQALYGPKVDRFIGQFCGAAIVLGSRYSASKVGGEYSAMYHEYNSEDIFVVNGQGASGFTYFDGDYETTLSKCHQLAPRMGDNTLSAASQVWSRTPMRVRGRRYSYAQGKSARNYVGSTINLSPHQPSGGIFYVNAPTVALGALDSDLNRLYGHDSATITFFGAGGSKEPTGTVTFTPPAGWTANGGSSATFSSLTAPTMFCCYWNLASTDVVVFPI